MAEGDLADFGVRGGPAPPYRASATVQISRPMVSVKERGASDTFGFERVRLAHRTLLGIGAHWRRLSGRHHRPPFPPIPTAHPRAAGG